MALGDGRLDRMARALALEARGRWGGAIILLLGGLTSQIRSPRISLRIDD